MNKPKLPPSYDWNCHSCQAGNAAGADRCGRCGCPSNATIRQIDGYRADRTATYVPQKTMFPRLQHHGFEFGVFVGSTALLLLVLYFLEFLAGFKSLANAGLLGDFVGGFIGTIFTIATVALLVSTLKNQLRTSRTQNFENKYFELVKMHRDNVAEFRVGEQSGRKVFVSLIRELQAILHEVRSFRGSTSLTQDEILVISYYALFFGVGPNSTRMLKSSLSSFNPQYVADLIDLLEYPNVKQRIKASADLSYEPLDGHQSRLGHYYRHLFQTVTYVDAQDLPIDKYDYVKTIRAQLTNYEQALLLVNSLTPLGHRWWDRKLIKKYRMVQNIPRDFFHSQNELDISRFFDGESDFEWQDQNAEFDYVVGRPLTQVETSGFAGFKREA